MVGVSLRPSDAVEGGAVPVNMNLLWKECRFVIFDYDGKGKPTTAFRLVSVNDDGQEFTQHYSAANPELFAPSDDGETPVAEYPEVGAVGKFLCPVKASQSLSKSSNFYILTSNTVGAGFPENKISDDASKFEGLYAYHIPVKQPVRVGLAGSQPAEGDGQTREKILSVPSQILRYPWDKKPAPVAGKAPVATAAKPVAGKPAAKPAPKAGTGLSAEVIDDCVEVIGTVIDSKDGEASRQDVAGYCFQNKQLTADPAKRDQIVSALFSISAKVLAEKGIILDGEKLSKAEATE